MPRRIAVLLAIWACFFLADRTASACSCMVGAPVCETFWKTDVVFAGQVLDIIDVEGPSDLPVGGRLVRFRVDRAWRGTSAGEIEVRTGRGGGDCGYDFKRGAKYLVYAHAYGGFLTTGICTRTKPLAEAAEDLAYFETAFAPSAAGRVFGRAQYQRQEDGSAIRPVSGYPVALAGEGKQWDTKTGADGSYEFKGVPVGVYAIELTVPTTEHAYGSREIKLVDPRGCAAADFYVVADGRIAARVLDAQGQPLPNVTIEVVRLDTILARNRFPDARPAQTDADGRAEAAQLRPDRYVVAINLTRPPTSRQPYPTLFFPGVHDLSEARVIDLNLGEHVELGAFTLPPALENRVLSGIVAWRDGQPAGGATVILTTERGVAGIGVNVGNSVRTDSDGRFSFRAPGGLRYSLRAFAPRGTPIVTWVATTPEFVLDGHTPVLNLVLDPPPQRR